MNREELKTILSVLLYNKKSSNFYRIIKKYYPEIEKDIINITNYLPDENTSVNERIYNIIYDIYKIPNCKNSNCLNKVKFNSYTRGYNNYCSKSCLEIDQKNLNFKYKKSKNEYFIKYGISTKNKLDKKINNKSDGENSLSNFIKSLNINVIENDRRIISPLELDIYIPDKNIAIEYDGLYWHSEFNGKDRFYHLDKTKKCNKKNIQLIHIFEDEWINKRNIVENKLKDILNIDNNLIKINEYEIKEVDDELKNEFLNLYHILGGDNISSVNLGLFYNNEIISIMTFIRKSRYNYKLDKFTYNFNYRFNNFDLAFKLLNYFKNNYEWNEIFSHSDRRWSNGNLYRKLGFKLDYKIEQNYYYVKNHIRYNKSDLAKTLKEMKYDFSGKPYISINIFLESKGYYKIWDCGYYQFKLRRNYK